MSAGPLGRVVEDDPDGVPHAGSDTAYTVSEVHAVFALRALHWPMMDCEGHSITLQKRYDLGAALHTRTLLGQDKLTACEALAWLGENWQDVDVTGAQRFVKQFRQLMLSDLVRPPSDGSV